MPNARIIGVRPIIAALLLCAQAAAPVFAQSFYGHDRGWSHGRMTPNGLVPDDYLQPSASGDLSRSSNPWGNYVNPQQAQSARRVIYRPAHAAHLSKPLGSGGHSMAYLNGMGGIDPATDGDMVLEETQASPTPAQQVSARPRYVSTGGAKHTAAKKPRMIYYTQPGGWTNGVYHGQPAFVGGGGTTYTMHGRGQY